MQHLQLRSIRSDGSSGIYGADGTAASATEDDETPTTAGPQTGFYSMYYVFENTAILGFFIPAYNEYQTISPQVA